MTRRVLSGAWLGLALLCAGLWRISPAPAQADDPLQVQEIATGVFVFEAPIELAAPGNQGAIANLGFIVGRDAVAVIDTGGSRRVGERLLAAIRARTTLPIRYVVNTHVHPDHLLGNAAFASSGAEFLGHARLPDALAARAAQYLSANEAVIGSAFAGTRIVPPSRLVSGPLLLDLGLRRIRLEAWPTGHTDSDLTVFDEATGTWFLGDLLFARHVPALDGSLRGWIANLRTLVSRQAARVVPGHGPASMPWPQAAEPLGRYLQSLEADVRAVVKGGGTIEEAARGAARGEAGRWELFEAFNARNATSAYHELEWE